MLLIAVAICLLAVIGVPLFVLFGAAALALFLNLPEGAWASPAIDVFSANFIDDRGCTQRCVPQVRLSSVARSRCASGVRPKCRNVRRASRVAGSTPCDIALGNGSPNSGGSGSGGGVAHSICRASRSLSGLKSRSLASKWKNAADGAQENARQGIEDRDHTDGER